MLFTIISVSCKFKYNLCIKRFVWYIWQCLMLFFSHLPTLFHKCVLSSVFEIWQLFNVMLMLCLLIKLSYWLYKMNYMSRNSILYIVILYTSYLREVIIIKLYNHLQEVFRYIFRLISSFCFVRYNCLIMYVW